MTGPFKLNGVPIRRVNARYVIATSNKIDLGGIDSKALDKISDEKYFAREKKSKKEKGEEAFMKQGEKPEVSHSYKQRRADNTDYRRRRKSQNPQGRLTRRTLTNQYYPPSRRPTNTWLLTSHPAFR